MKKLLFLSVVLFNYSCKNNRVQHQPNNPETPKVLQGADNNESRFLFSKSYNGGRENMVLLLYDDLMKSDSSLKSLHTSILKLDRDKHDTLNMMALFTGNNSSYYSSAMSMLGSIKDSTLRSYIKAKVDSSQSAYEHEISSQKSKIDLITKLSKDLNDYYAVLKIMKTLPIIEKYQKDEKPSMNSLKEIEERYKNLINQVNAKR